MAPIPIWIQFIAIFNAVAFLHGIILALIVFKTADELRPANRYLAALILSFSFGLLDSLKHLSEAYISLPHAYFPAEICVFIYGPLLWFYIKKITDPSFILTRRSLLHFIPAMIFYILHLPLDLAEPAGRSAGSDIMLHNLSSFEIALFLFLAIIPAYLYIWACFRILRRHSQAIRETYSRVDKIDLSWMWTILIILVTLWSIFLLFLLGSFSGITLHPDPSLWIQAINFLIAWVIYVIGYKAMADRGVIPSAPTADISKLLPEALSNAAERAPRTIDPVKKYEKSTLKPLQAQRIVQQLMEAMTQEKLYLDSELTLPQLSTKLNIPVHQISQVLNENIRQNFYRFVNSYRIEDAKNRLCESSEERSDKMITLAFSVGFQSLSTFNRVFKEFCGVSPSIYRKLHSGQPMPDVPPVPS